MLAPASSRARRRGTGIGQLPPGTQLALSDVRRTLSEDDGLQPHDLLEMQDTLLLPLQRLAR